MRPVSPAIPVSVTSTSPRPRVTAVFMYTAVTRSASGTSAPTVASADFATAMASPVRTDSCTSSELDANSRPSAGTRSPAARTTTSPGTSSSASNRTSRPSRRTVAVVTVICRRASSAASARDSCTNPIVALSNTTTTIATGVSHSRDTTRLTAAAINRMTISRSWNCRMKDRHAGSRRAAASRFGPYSASRRAASGDDSPVERSTSSPAATARAGRACQKGGTPALDEAAMPSLFPRPTADAVRRNVAVARRSTTTQGVKGTLSPDGHVMAS